GSIPDLSFTQRGLLRLSRTLSSLEPPQPMVDCNSINCLLGFLLENRNRLHHAALHGGLMGADAHAGPVSAVNVAGDRVPVLNNASDEFMDQVGMGAPMASTLKERQVGIAFIVYRLPGKSPNLRRQAVRIVRDLDALFRHQPASAVVVH